MFRRKSMALLQPDYDMPCPGPFTLATRVAQAAVRLRDSNLRGCGANQVCSLIQHTDAQRVVP